jgi:hypothetical protein
MYCGGKWELIGKLNIYLQMMWAVSWLTLVRTKREQVTAVKIAQEVLFHLYKYFQT